MPRKVKGFSRVDSGEAHGWLVRIKRGDVKRSRFISDSTHGGKRKSKLFAEQVYQEWVEELPEPDTAEGKLGKRNASGVVGVHYSHDVDSRYPNCAYEYYIASWKTEDGRRQNVRFAINKLGKKKAFELACIARSERTTDRAKVERIHGRRTKPGSKKKKVAAKAKVSPKSRPASKKKTTPKKSAKKKTAKKKTVAKKVPASKSPKKKTASKKAARKKSAQR